MTVRFCPRCAIELDVKLSNKVEVDVCSSCGGVWLDSGEFDLAIASRFRTSNLEVQFAFTARDNPMGLDCPLGHGAMAAVPFESLELDRCSTCLGIWIDGEDTDHFSRPAPKIEAHRDVNCAGCDATTKRGRSIQRAGVFFCEACTLDGNFPRTEDDYSRYAAHRDVIKGRGFHDRRSRLGSWWWEIETAMIEFIAHTFRGF